MPYPTETDVCNMALSRIGQWQISDLYLDSETERHCRLHLPHVRRLLLRRHAWDFSILRAELEESAVEGHGEVKRFDLPGDYLQLLAAYEEVGGDYAIDRFKVEGKALLCYHETAFIEYIADIVEPIEWSVDFLECVVLKLGSRLCVPLGAPATRGQELLQELEQLAFPQATLNNAWEDSSGENNPTADRLYQSEYIRANHYEL